MAVPIIRIDAREVEAALADALRRAPAARRAALRRTALIVQRAATELAPVDRGELRAKILIREAFTSSFGGLRVRGEESEQILVTSEAKHAVFVERGTRSHTPPFRPIQRWALRHGIEPGAVWQAIRRRGTRAHPYMAPAAERGRQVLPEIATEELRRWAGG